jgi:hypothetical protein
MSDNQDAHSSASEASGIIQQMHNLVDVESGLAEAYLAVEDQASSVDAAGATDTTADEIAIDDESAAGAENDSDPFLAEAERVEGALESAIPPAPSHSVQPVTSAESSIPGLGNDPRLHQAAAAAAASSHDHDAVSQAATEAQHAIDAVNADIPAPVLPEQVAGPAHDIVMETKIEEETSPMQVDEEEEEVRPRYDPSEPQEPISYDPSEPQTRYDPSEPQEQQLAPVRYDPSEPQGEDSAPVRYDPSEPQDTTPVSYDPSVPQQPLSVDQPSGQTTRRDSSQVRETSLAVAAADSPAASVDVKPAVGPDPRLQQLPVKPETTVESEFPSNSTNDRAFVDPLPGRPLSDLPENITEQSPSVIANKEMTHRWRASKSADIPNEPVLIPDPNDSQALLRLYGWSVDNTEINDARAWYAVIAKDNPSAVCPRSCARLTV